MSLSNQDLHGFLLWSYCIFESLRLCSCWWQMLPRVCITQEPHGFATHWYFLQRTRQGGRMLWFHAAPAAVHPTGYCEESQGPAMCLEGSCFCVGSQGCIKTNILVISMVNSRLVVQLRHLQYWGLEGSVFENGKCQEPKVFGVNEGGENMLGWWVLVCWCELFPFVVGLGFRLSAALVQERRNQKMTRKLNQHPASSSPPRHLSGWWW